MVTGTRAISEVLLLQRTVERTVKKNVRPNIERDSTLRQAHVNVGIPVQI